MAKRHPKYQLHKASGQAVVRLGTHDFYLGKHGSPESYAAYDRHIIEWLANGRRVPTSSGTLEVSTLIRGFLEHVRGEYRSNEPELVKAALKPLYELYGDTAAAEFGPVALKIVRERIRANGHVRTQVNKRVRIIVRAFRWAVSNEMLPASVWESLRSVESLRKGKPGTREGKTVQPVDDADVDAVLPHVSRQIAAMIQVQRHTGARPGEVCAMRSCDVDASGEVWIYRPPSHKTDHLGHGRAVFIGPMAQKALGSFLRGSDAAYVFSPRDAETERMAGLRAVRKSKVQPSQVDRSRVDRIGRLSDHYTDASYRQAVERGIAKANEQRTAAGLEPVRRWTPNQLRHATATRIRRELGLEVAQVVLGHSTLTTTQVYAKRAEDKARDAMGRMG
ncbi:tyrosine-type recombinase/integrase [Paludisphaera rhizosphaerae]|uniref:tyrosine-type recombinase/integrase n=1 Tax=Paludisphaera rhizosphaerae TaxID=2711216 RepID=UPI0013EAA89E|nr:site-specific integrase [Paludisphaera rhizosphaerae]